MMFRAGLKFPWLSSAKLSMACVSQVESEKMLFEELGFSLDTF
jgi:hypothetical protein